MGADRPRAGVPRAVAEARPPTGAALGSGLVAVVVFAWWAATDGGYAPGASAPGALLFVGVLVVSVATGRARLAGGARVPVLTLAAFTAWSFASIAWADARGDAWDGANRTLLYLWVFALFAMVPRRPREGALVLGAFAVATVAVCVASFGAAVATDAEDAFPGSRFSGSIGYANAVAALLLAAFWSAVLLASRRATPAIPRGVLLAAAGVALELVVLTQSRGALIAGAVTVVLALALAPERTRLLAALGAVGLPALAALPVLLELFDATGAAPTGRLGPSAVAVGVSAVVLAAGGWAWGRRDAVGYRPVRALRATRRRLAGLAVAGAVLAVAAGLAQRERSDVAATTAPAAGSRLTVGVESGRYDIWRVALHQFAREPVLGVGADNFAADYARERRTHESPLYPHSIALRVPAQTGMVGVALFGAFLIAVAAAARQRRIGAQAAMVPLAAAVSAAAWLVQGSIDWLWEIPAVAGPAMASLGLMVAEPPRHARARRATPGRLSVVVAVVVVLAAVLSLVVPALAAREIDEGIRTYAADPAAARERFERARGLNPLSPRADVVAGSLARRTGDDRRAMAAFARAVDRDARDWYPHVELALIAAEAGRGPVALAYAARARALNPRSSLVRQAAAAAERGREPSALLRRRLAGQAVTGPLRRRPATCVPTFALRADCPPAP